MGRWGKLFKFCKQVFLGNPLLIIKLMKCSRNTLTGAWQVIEYLRTEIRTKMEISFFVLTLNISSILILFFFIADLFPRFQRMDKFVKEIACDNHYLYVCIYVFTSEINVTQSLTCW